MVWSGRPPGTATNTLQRHVSGLRELLGTRSAVRATGPGYLLDVADDATDVQVARRLLRQGTDQLRTALALWRGPALSGLRGLDWFAAEADRLDEFRLEIELAMALALRGLGRLDEAIDWCQQSVARHRGQSELHLEASALTRLGDIQHEAGRPDEARSAWRRALEVLERFNDPDADAVRERLRDFSRLGS